MALQGQNPPREPGGRLPEIVAVEAARVRYPEPRVYFVGPEQRQAREAVELVVRTSAPLPVLDLPPILFVGETAVPEYAPEGRATYRFVAFEEQRLEPGAPIALGWPQAPRARRPSRFRFQLGGQPGGPAVA